MRSLSVFIVMSICCLFVTCTEPVPENASMGMRTFVQSDCVRCHGADLAGSERGPSLIGVHEYWNETQLFEYINNPSRYAAQNERLNQLKQQYPEPMPALPLDDQTVTNLVNFVLNKSKELSQTPKENQQQDQ